MSKQYLYGAAVQGIQGFIFQTNELKDIVGASELVNLICNQTFARLLYGDETINQEKACEKLNGNANAILHAAGNIKYIFDDEKECKKVVRSFPRKVMEMAPGITVSQAVVEMGESFEKSVQELEQRLRAQRNRPMRSATLGLAAIKRSRQTGLPVVDCKEMMDAATAKKRANGGKTSKNLCRTAFGMNLEWENIPFDIKELTVKNDWIAVVHADGNGLGQVVMKVGKDKKLFKEFSENLNRATVEAAQLAFESLKDKGQEKIPIRPIVLGGDDLTVIIRGDLAIDYVKEFLKQFEEKTNEYLGDIFKKFKKTKEEKTEEGKKEGEKNIGIDFDRLTACAGIAFIKSSYPYYYGYNLAEALCERTKKDAKKEVRLHNGLAQSCLMFHKVQDSFVESFDAIAKRELQPCQNVSWEFGPYYLDGYSKAENEKDRWTIPELVKASQELDGEDGNAVKSHLRRWMSAMHENPSVAKQRENRMKSLFKDKIDKYLTPEKRDEGDADYYPVYDILAYHTIMNQETKTKNKE